MSLEKFDLGKVKEFFDEAIIDDDDVLIEFYLKAFKELYKYKLFKSFDKWNLKHISWQIFHGYGHSFWLCFQ